MTDGGKELLPPENEEHEVPEEIGEIVEEMGEEKIQKIIEYRETHFGPIPHPRTLAQYQEIIPDAANRIIKMAERQQNHRMSIEKRVIYGDIVRADIGLKLGFALFMMFGLGSIILLAFGKDTQGYALLATSLIGGIGNFIRVGRERVKEAKKEEKPKRKRRQVKRKTITKKAS